jgi:Polysaccharide deacetylase
MCSLLPLVFLLVVGTSFSGGIDSSTSSTCTPRDCQLPACFCAGLTPPSDIPVDQTPQMVVLTFDDAVLSDFEVEVYKRILNGDASSNAAGTGSGRGGRRRTNPNGCPIAATFYVSHNGTDYGQVGRLHRAGHEIASHSISHRLPQSYWTSATYEKWRREIAGQRDNLVRMARLDADREGANVGNEGGDSMTASRRPTSTSKRRGHQSDDVVGMRAPFLETGGDEQFRMMADEGFVYDSSMMTGPHQAGAVWPFTLDFPPTVEFCSNNRFAMCTLKKFVTSSLINFTSDS